MALISERLADFTAGLSLQDVPLSVTTRAKHLLLDAVGCAYAAREEEFAIRIARNDDRRVADGGGAEIAGIRHLDRQAQKGPHLILAIG